MRIVGGKYRGKKLFSPVGESVRPTSDKAREALFSIIRSRLGADFSCLNLLDLFAGSGAFALEAVSRGFAKVVLVDIDVSNLQKNVGLFEAEKSKISVIRTDVAALEYRGEKFDVLFADAPYAKGLSEVALAKAMPLLKKGALCLIEMHKDENCLLPKEYKLLDERRYGIAKIVMAEFTC